MWNCPYAVVIDGVLIASICVDDLSATEVCVCVCVHVNDNGTLLGCVYLNP